MGKQEQKPYLTRYDAAVAKMMALMGMDGAGETMSADMDTSPQYYTCLLYTSLAA